MILSPICLLSVSLTQEVSLFQVELLLRGIYPSEYPGSVVYKPWQIVDVRDCAAGHVGLLESVKISNGERAPSNDRLRCSLSPC